MKIIDNISTTYNLSEASHGTREVQFAFIDGKTGETITPFCMCKDYFNDMFFTKTTKKSVDIYGFKWKSDQDKGILDRNTLAVAVRLRDRNNHNNKFEIKEEERVSVLALLSKFAKILKLGRITVRLCEEKKNLIISFNKKWSEIPYLNSAFFLFVRLGFTYKKDEDPFTWYTKSDKFISPNDESYFRTAKNKIKDLLEGKIDKNQNYSQYTTGSIHNSSGIVGYSKYKVD